MCEEFELQCNINANTKCLSAPNCKNCMTSISNCSFTEQYISELCRNPQQKILLKVNWLKRMLIYSLMIIIL